MNEDDIWQRLTAVFRDVFDDDRIVIAPETTARDIEGWDSLANIELLVAIEKSFGRIKFNTGEVANLRNVGELVAAIKRKTGRN
jgi:acyl carrier protein